MANTIESELAAYITAQILKQPNREIKPDEPLISSGLIDSFSLMDLALYVEDTFGVRIEDTVLVTKDGYEILTKYAPKEISEIETLMSGHGIPNAMEIVNRQP